MGTRYGQLDAKQASDLGYLPAKILLDGKEIRNVSIVNDIEGWIDVYKTDADGHIIAYDGLNDPHTETFRMYGDVVYTPKDGTSLSKHNHNSHKWVGIPSQSVGSSWPTDPIRVCSECGIEDLGDPDEFPDLQYPNCNDLEGAP